MMDQSKKDEFMRMLEKCMGAYGKPLPERSIVDSFVDLLEPFPLRVIGMAFVSYIDDNDTFEPKPAAILKRCKLLDGRPGAEEAWALALTGQNEADTVVWTQEVAEAFAIASPVLESSGAISARKTFIEAYERIVSKARLERKPTQWIASLGWDLRQREAVLKKAVCDNLLSAPSVAALLPPPDGSSRNDKAAQDQIIKIKEMMTRMNLEKHQEIALHAQRDRDELVARKAELDVMTKRRTS